MVQRLKNIYHLLQAFPAHIWYGFPSRKLKVIGVTGTDGKTTTTHLIYHILRQAGKRVSMISTIYAKIGDKEYDTGFHVTTPDAFLVPKYLNLAVEARQEYFVLETTSHAIDQNRVWGIEYNTAVLTNITHEHLDYHKNINEYARIKMRLITGAKTGIVNADDEVTQDFIGKLKSKIPNLKTFGLINKADYSLDVRKDIPNLADFNAYNYLAAYAVCRELGLSDKEIQTALPSFVLPSGRLDIVYYKKFMVIVDFAHTPNAIERILQTVKKQYIKENGRIIHVFGSAGLRDHSKRPFMGAASAKFADISIITEEDYRIEDPVEIAEQIAEGFRENSKPYSIIINRKEAIEKALSLAKENDVVIITGKGHEKSLCRGTREYPWSDKECVQTYVSIQS